LVVHEHIRTIFLEGTTMSDETITIIGGPEPQVPSLAVVTRERILKLIEDYLQTETPLRDVARALTVLPLSEAAAERWYGIKPNGDLLSFETRSPFEASEEEDLWTRATTLSRALKRYPELEPLIPPPPLSCRTCPRCRGKGVITRVDGEVSCICDGLGWMPPVYDKVERRERREPERHFVTPEE
jgi:hypothetical protein